MKTLLLLFIFLYLNAFASLFEEASKYYKQEDFIKSFKLYEQLAKQGNINAQYNLGIFYDKGLGVKKNKKLAFIWILTAANNNHTLAQNKLGKMYETGYLPDLKDKNNALEQYLKAANSGYDFAQINLAMHYYNIGTKDAFKKAFYWYKKATKTENIVAINNIANMYYFGQGTKRDYKEAAKYYLIAANRNDMLAQYNLSMMYYMGEHFIKNYKKALHWLKKSATNGYKVAQVKLATFYKEANSLIVEQDYKKSLYWYFKAAKQNYAPAQYYVGFFYYHGLAVDKNIKIATFWMNKSKNNGYKSADNFMKRNKLFAF